VIIRPARRPSQGISIRATIKIVASSSWCNTSASAGAELGVLH